MNELAPDKPARLLHKVPDAAAALSVGTSTVWKLIADGKLQVVKIGRSTRVPHSELLKLTGLQQ